MSDDKPVPPALLRQHLEGCEKRWDDNERRTRALEDAVNEHRIRLENGSHVFQDMRKEHEDFKGDVTDRAEKAEISMAERIAELTPMPPSPLKVASLVLTVVAMAGGALWGLSTMLNDRPTTEQIKEVLEVHQDHGHEDTKMEIRAIRDVQSEQKVQIEEIAEDVGETDKKLDELLERVPHPDSPRGRRPR